MGEAQFYHIMFEAPGMGPSDERLELQLNTALDWLRYAENCWIVYTTSDAKRWYERLGALAKDNKGHVFIAKFDIGDRQGWMPKSVWDWLKKDREGKSA